MRNFRKRTVAGLCAAVLLLSLGGCGVRHGSSRPPLNTQIQLAPEESLPSFSAQSSRQVQLSQQAAQVVLQIITQQQVTYPYEQYYNLEESVKRLSYQVQVQQHAYCVLTDDGRLDAQHFVQLVQQNNAAFLQEHTFGYEDVDADYLQQLCTFILQIVECMQESHPDLDWDRVWCVLGELKILYKNGMLSFAEVNKDRVLCISQNNTGIILKMKGEDGFTRVLIHETMHLLQFGCSCEQIENCSRRAGIALYWEDFPENSTDWTWLAEGSAERHMCRLTGGDAISYQYKIDYICSFNMALLLQDTVDADFMENLCFYDDPQPLFDAFGCETTQQRLEVIKLMTTVNVLQMLPSGFTETYKAKTGIDLNADEDVCNQFYYELKPAVCMTLTKTFYKNLAGFVAENGGSVNDICFLINLFEGHLNQHLNFKNEEKAALNEPYFQLNSTLRQALFAALEQENEGLDMQAEYDTYAIENADGSLNAELSQLSEEKRDFLASRAAWQKENLGLGVKAPEYN